MKFFEFKYSSKSSKYFENFGYKLTNLFLPFVPLMIVIAFTYQSPIAKSEWYPITVKIMLFLCFVFGIVLVVNFDSKAKGVFISNEYIDIDRHSVSYWRLSKMNYKINISDVDYCRIENKSISNYSARYYNMMGGTGYPFVMLKTKDNTFCFCIENQEKFVDEVNKRVKTLNNKNM